MSSHRRLMYHNPEAKTWKTRQLPTAQPVLSFHQKLPGYQESPLVSLSSVAKDIGVKAVYVKDDTSRLGLPSCNILGISWGVFRAISDKLGLPITSQLDAVKEHLHEQPITLYTASRGNDACAVSRMGALLAIPVRIFVPDDIKPEILSFIRMEGSKATIVSGSYENCLAEAYLSCQSSGGIFIKAEASYDYLDVPRWIIEGYMTLLCEVDSKMPSENVDLLITPVGLGALTQAATNHFKTRKHSNTSIMTVEPDASCLLWKSLNRRAPAVGTTTSATIMTELNVEKLSETLYPTLRSAIDASVTVSDYEAHIASVELQSFNVRAGPSGAATLAALRRLDPTEKRQLGLNENSVVVLLCTEGLTEYAVPRSVAVEEVIALTKTLVQIDSSNPDFGSVPGPGETSIARYITDWLQYRDIEVHWIEPTKGRPSVVGVVRGTGGGKTLMFNGHMDTVTLLGYHGDPLSAHVADGNLYGRGSADMKSGLASSMMALAAAKSMSLKGDVILAAVADEESESIGTEQLLRAGWRADAAIVAEPTGMALINTHKGFALFEVDIHGVASHGSRADLGVDAICKAGYFLVELDRHAQELQGRFGDQSPETGAPNIHCGVIKGGEEIASYPAMCTIFVERRTIAGETAETVHAELSEILERLAASIPNFKYALRSTFSRAPYFISRDDSFVALVAKHASKSMGVTPTIKGETYWTDMALLADVGIPGLIWGPKGYGLHAKTEWVEVESVKQLAQAFIAIMEDFCK